MEGSPAVSGAANPFEDVPAGKYYTNAVLWAADHKIVNGKSENRFAPDDNVTREQIAAILYRYAQSKGYGTEKTADLSAFPDAAEVSAYAGTALSWANAEGLITGTKAGDRILLDPDGSATRAQVATILMRFQTNVAQ